MIDKIAIAFVPGLVLALGGLPLAGVAVWRSWQQRREDRQSPLSGDMLRPPGHGLRKRIADLNADIEGLWVAVALVPIIAYALYLSESHFLDEPDSLRRIAVLGFVCVGFEFFAIRSLASKLDDRRKYDLGMDGEMATGQALDQLMLEGCRVFHDVPMGNYGNIDHVVVSRSGVFSVNTKTIRKPKNCGYDKVPVDYHHNVVRFPHFNYAIPSERLEAEARWLSKHLTSAIGETVEVEPMLALPGWCIGDRVGQKTQCVINPVRATKWFLNSRDVHTPESIQRIAHQLDRLCRDVKPSQRAERGWS